MAKKKRIERWVGELLGAGQMELKDVVDRNLSGRELVIVTTSLLDVALTETLSMRLHGPQDAIERFLGIADDAPPGAPGASLSARTQLALLTGLINPSTVDVLNALRILRNHMAHRVRVDVLGTEVQADLDRLVKALKGFSVFGQGAEADLISELRRAAKSEAKAVDDLFLAAAAHMYRLLVSTRLIVQRINPWMEDHRLRARESQVEMARAAATVREAHLVDPLVERKRALAELMRQLSTESDRK